MSATDTLRAEVQQYIQDADASFLQDVKEMYKHRQAEARDWWDGTPEHIKESLREISARPIGEGALTSEEVRARVDRWLRR